MSSVNGLRVTKEPKPCCSYYGYECRRVSCLVRPPGGWLLCRATGTKLKVCDVVRNVLIKINPMLHREDHLLSAVHDCCYPRVFSRSQCKDCNIWRPLKFSRQFLGFNRQSLGKPRRPSAALAVPSCILHRSISSVFRPGPGALTTHYELGPHQHSGTWRARQCKPIFRGDVYREGK
jgi:hypothetical protein